MSTAFSALGDSTSQVRAWHLLLGHGHFVCPSCEVTQPVVVSSIVRCDEASLGGTEETVSVHSKLLFAYENELCVKCLASVKSKVPVFWEYAPHGLSNCYRRLKGLSVLVFRVWQSKKSELLGPKYEGSKKFRNVGNFTGRHCVTCLKTWVFRITAVRTTQPYAALVKHLAIHFNLLKTKRICFIQGLSAYRAVNTLHFGYKNQSLNVL
jgi:hypothetical protein